MPRFLDTEEEKDRFAADPELLFSHTHQLSAAMMHFFDVLKRGTPMQAEMQAIVRKNMIEELGEQHLIDKLVPDWDVWCRRVTPCTSFIEA